LIILTDGKVDKVTSDAVKIDVQEVVEEFQPVLIYVAPHSFFSE